MTIATFLMLHCGLVNRYCKRAKSVFRELDQVPYVVELDERGAFLRLVNQFFIIQLCLFLPFLIHEIFSLGHFYCLINHYIEDSFVTKWSVKIESCRRWMEHPDCTWTDCWKANSAAGLHKWKTHWRIRRYTCLSFVFMKTSLCMTTFAD